MQSAITDSGRNNQVDIDPSAHCGPAVQLRIEGNHNHLRIGPRTRLTGGLIELRNHHGRIEIGADCVLNGQFRCRADQAQLIIGDATTIMSAIITLHEAGRISLGRDCMLSGDIQMDVSDMHSIIDVASGARINPPQDIEIGTHVWLGQGVRVLKGARIGDNCIIGSRALVTGDIPAGSIAVGVPARVVRQGVTWDRRRLPWA
jgi:acetyltransferase-like isoleucine patch superfamily enzyme